jgi:hypothetical protein
MPNPRSGCSSDAFVMQRSLDRNWNGSEQLASAIYRGAGTKQQRYRLGF